MWSAVCVGRLGGTRELSLISRVQKASNSGLSMLHQVWLTGTTSFVKRRISAGASVI